jgi:hypothetical protein
MVPSRCDLRIQRNHLDADPAVVGRLPVDADVPLNLLASELAVAAREAPGSVRVAASAVPDVVRVPLPTGLEGQVM